MTDRNWKCVVLSSAGNIPIIILLSVLYSNPSLDFGAIIILLLSYLHVSSQLKLEVSFV